MSHSDPITQIAPPSSLIMAPQLLTLPNELLLGIAAALPTTKDLSSLILTNRFLSALLTPLLHDLSSKPHDNWTAIEWAIRAGHIPPIKLLISRGVDIYDTTSYQIPLLFTAVLFGSEDATRLILAQGIDVNGMSSGASVLHRAALIGNVGVAKILLAAGAEVDM